MWLTFQNAFHAFLPILAQNNGNGNGNGEGEGGGEGINEEEVEATWGETISSFFGSFFDSFIGWPLLFIGIAVVLLVVAILLKRGAA